MDLSIIIINWNGGADILRCLASLQGCSWISSSEVIVVDNGSEDDSVARIRSDFPFVSILETGVNLGFARAANLGWRRAQGECVLFLNPDTSVPANALQQALAYIHAHPQIGVLGVKLLNQDGSLQVSCWNFLSVPMLLCDNLLRLPILPRSFTGRFLYRLWDHRTTREVDWVCGACMLLHRSTLEEVNGFSEDYFMYGEDMDLCYKVKQQSYTVVFYAEEAVVHYGNRSGEKRWAERREAEIVRAELIFLWKHRGRLSWRLFRTIAGGTFLAKSAFFFLRAGKNREEKWKTEAVRYWQMVRVCWGGSGQLT